METILNFNADLFNGDMNTFQDTVDNELKNRLLVLMGTGEVEHGIVSPKDTTNEDASLPLMVYANAVATKVNVNPGIVVFKTGDMISLPSLVQGLQLADSTVGIVNFVIMEFSLAASDLRTSMTSLETVPAIYKADYPLKIVTESDYNDPLKFQLSRKNKCVILAACTMVKDSNGDLSCSVDVSRSKYSFIRPWFSIVDYKHRSYLGTGTPTDKNPHGTSISDLSSGNLSFYQLMMSGGAIISKDVCIPNMPGFINTETYAVSDIKTDATGSVTGTINSLYVTTSNYPISLLGANDASIVQNKIAIELVAGKNVIKLGKFEQKVAFTVRYLSSQACQPPMMVTNNRISFSQPASTEVVISSGKEYSTISNPTLNFENQGPIPQIFNVYSDQGKLVQNPTVILSTLRLESLKVPYIFSTNLPYESKIIIGLTLAAKNSTVTFKLMGKAVDDSPITEYLTFGSSWLDSTIPSVYNEQQFVESKNYFASLTSIEIDSRKDDGTSAMITLYANFINAMYDCALVAKVNWNGLAVDAVTDCRKIIPYVSSKHSISETFYPSLLNMQWLFDEDFSKPQYLDVCEDSASKTLATGTITIINDQLVDGDTVIIHPSKGLSIKAKSTTATLAGEYLIGADATTTRDNMIVAINALNCGIQASTNGDNGVSLVVTDEYFEENFLLTKTSSNPLAIVVTGYQHGYSAMSPVLRNRHVDYLKGFYRTRPFTLQQSFNKIFVFAYRSTNLTMSIRYTLNKRESVWLKPSAMSKSNGLYVFNAPDFIGKFYLEINGEAQGITVLASN